MNDLSISNYTTALSGLIDGKPLPAGTAKDKADGIKAAKDFESVLLEQLMEEMQKTVGKSGLLEDSTGEQVQSLFWMNLSQEIANQGGIGLWKQLYSQTSGKDDCGSPVSGCGLEQQI